MTNLLVLLGGYVFGLFQTAYFVGRMKHQDIRTVGSGNAGATNTLRAFGFKAGFTVFLGDLLKSVIYCLIIRYALVDFFGERALMMMFIGGIGVVLGHTYPFYLGFKGGKGIACTAGLILCFDWRIALLCFALFLLLVMTTQYVSLASLSAMVLFLILEQVFLHFGWIVLPAAYAAEIQLLSIAFVLLAFYAHRSNILRLIYGKENKTKLFK